MSTSHGCNRPPRPKPSAPTYDAANNLKSTVSSSTGGLDVSYDYDGLNRLETVYDGGAAQPPLEHSYSYDANGNLESLTYSNGVSHTWTYDSQNRLKNLSVLNSSLAILNSYAYNLRASGHRSSVTEASGRTVGYSYDNQYRLTQEAITGDPSVVDGTSDWAYDLVGNRLSQSSSIGSVPSVVESYSDNNWLDSHEYDDNGNTIRSAPLQQATEILNDSYDWRNRLVRREKSDGTIIEIVYDGFGDRVKKTLSTLGSPLPTTTWFLVDRNNLTGYAQVVEEIAQGGDVEVIYTYGLDLISQDRRDNDSSGNFTQSFYLYDGLGSVRGLTDSSGAISDEYTYDAWGVLLSETHSSPVTTPNSYRFTGEQWDADLGMVFLRARYLNVATGRFQTMDTFEGVSTDPVTLHKYLYANAAPNMWTDPTGMFTLTMQMQAIGVLSISQSMAVVSTGLIVNEIIEAKSGVAGELGESAIGIAQQAFVQGQVGSLLALNSTRAAIEEAIKGLSEAQKRARRKLKVVPQPRSLFREIVDNITARTGGAPQLLTRVASSRARANRRAAIRGRGPAGVGFSWDEYPFASTRQGGSGARVARVPLRENLVQGGVIGAAYRIQGIRPGDTFWMVTLP